MNSALMVNASPKSVNSVLHYLNSEEIEQIIGRCSGNSVRERPRIREGGAVYVVWNDSHLSPTPFLRLRERQGREQAKVLPMPPLSCFKTALPVGEVIAVQIDADKIGFSIRKGVFNQKIINGWRTIQQGINK